MCVIVCISGRRLVRIVFSWSSWRVATRFVAVSTFRGRRSASATGGATAVSATRPTFDKCKTLCWRCDEPRRSWAVPVRSWWCTGTAATGPDQGKAKIAFDFQITKSTSGLYLFVSTQLVSIKISLNSRRVAALSARESIRQPAEYIWILIYDEWLCWPTGDDRSLCQALSCYFPAANAWKPIWMRHLTHFEFVLAEPLNNLTSGKWFTR